MSEEYAPRFADYPEYPIAALNLHQNFLENYERLSIL